MKFIGNLLWFFPCGMFASLSWAIVGVIWCATIIGIPVGLQCFKLASLSLCPFGRSVDSKVTVGNFLLNIIWFIFSGLWLALEHVCWGLIMCVTIVGIPFGIQHFKLAGLALAPFGKEVV